MRPRIVLWLLGAILRPFAVLLLFPAVVDLLYGATGKAVVFAITAAVSFAIGTLLTRRMGEIGRIGRVEAMAVVAGAWLVAAALGSVPYVEQGFGLIDALFESMSGFTTTGSTIFTGEDFERLSRGLLFWRAMTQWLGGMGIIVLFVAVLPALAVAGRQMFFAEAPGPEEEALTPRIRETASALWKLYIALTAVEATLLTLFGGMSLYEGICHAFTTLAAGGFSPNGRSLAGYSATAQWIVIPFMFLAGASFALQYRVRRRPIRILRDLEFRWYAGILLSAGLGMALLLAIHRGDGFFTALRHGLFQAASILTTTGYASDDFSLWHPSVLVVLGALMFIGGCAGSAGGGPKVVRLIILVKYVAREILTAVHPRAVRPIRLGPRVLPPETVRQVIGFFVAYLLIFAAATVIVGVIEDDLVVGFTGSIVTLGNIGPGYGAIGPMDTFAGLSPVSKVLFILTMWVGRLEVMTVLALLHPDVFRTLVARRRKGSPPPP